MKVKVPALWLATQGGFVAITGRIKDLIIRGGENIHPLEVENCLFQQPLVQEVSVVGVPDENVGSPAVTNAGAVHVLTTSGDHFLGASLRYFHQDRTGIPGDLGTDHDFGYSLAPGDYNGDGKEDLAIGVPGDSCTVSGDGSVLVIYDDVWGALADYEPQYWCQGGDIGDQGEMDDHFGVALAALPSTGALPHRVYLPICMRDD